MQEELTVIGEMTSGKCEVAIPKIIRERKHYLLSLQNKINYELTKYPEFKNIKIEFNDLTYFSEIDVETFMLHDETVEAVCKTLSRKFSGKNLSIIGCMQSDKARTLIIAALLYISLRKILTNKKEDVQSVLSLIITPGPSDLRENLKRVFNSVSSIFTNACFVNTKTNEKVFISSAYSESQASIYNLISKKYKKDFSSGTAPIFSLNDKSLNIVKELAYVVTQNNFRLDINRDEAHHSINFNSLSDRIFQQYPDNSPEANTERKNALREQKEIKNLYDLTANHPKIQLTCCTATGFDAYSSFDNEEVFIELAEGYCGVPIHKHYNGLIPHLLTVKTLAEFPINLEHINFDHYKSIAKWEKSKTIHHSSHEEYVKYVHETLFKGIEHSYKNREKTNNKGMLIRLKENQITKNIINYFKTTTISANIQFIDYSSDKTINKKDRKSLIEILDENEDFKTNNKFYVIFVTGKARMGNNIPKEIQISIDFAQKATTLSSLLQGNIGRACGYGKQYSVVYVSKYNKKIFDDFMNGIYTIPQTNAHNKISTQSERIEFNISNPDPNVQRIFRNIKKYLPNLTSNVLGIGEQMVDKLGIEFFEYIIDNDLFNKLESNYGTFSRTISKTRNGLTLIEKRTNNSQSKKGGGKKGASIIFRYEENEDGTDRLVEVDIPSFSSNSTSLKKDSFAGRLKQAKKAA